MRVATFYELPGILVVFPDGSKHVLYLNSAFSYTGTYTGQAGSNIPIANSWDINSFSVISGTGTYCGPAPSGVANITGPAVLVYFTQDNTFVRVEVVLNASNTETDFYIYFIDGRLVHGTCTSGGCYSTQSISDRDGNTINIETSHLSDNWEPVTTITDSLGRTITITNNFPASGAEPSQPTDTITTAGFGGNLSTTVIWAGFTSGNPDSKGNTYSYECVQNPGSGVSGDCGTSASGVAFNPGTFAVSSITLPSALGTAPGQSRSAGDGILQYTFGYSLNPGWGQLNQITTPLGETAHYTYLDDNVFFLGGLPQPPNSIVAKSLSYVDPSGTTRTRNWTYSGYGSTGGTTVTNPDGGTEVHGFVNVGPSTLSIPAPTYDQQPNGIITDRLYSGSCAVPNYGGLGNFFVSAEMHTIGNETAVTTYGYDRNGNVISKTEYDFIPASSVPRNSSTNFEIARISVES